MSYTKTNWQDLPNQTTPITATRLNNMENGIANSDGAIGVNEYSTSSTYAIGDYCLHDNKLYRCKTTISTAEAWTSGHWTQVKIVDAIDDTQEDLADATKGYQTSTTGVEHEITDCAGVNGKLYIDGGKTEQNGNPTPTVPVDIVSVGSNINLFNSSNYLENYTISSGAIASGSENNNLYYIPVKYGKNYVINFEGDLSTNCIYGYCDTTPANGVSATSNVSTINNLKTLILTPPSSSNKYLLLRLNRVTQYPNMSNIKIEEGTQATGYSQYNAGSIDFKVSNKNIFDKTKVVNGYRLGQDGKGASDTNYYVSEFIKVDANTQYTKNSPTADAYHRFAFYTSNSDTTTISVSSDNTVTTPSNCQYLRFCGLKTELDTTQVEKGSSATSYVAHQEQIVTVPMPVGMELCNIGDYEDKFVKQNGKWYKYSEIGEVILNGAETWTRDNAQTGLSYYSFYTNAITSSAKSECDLYCDKLLKNTTVYSVDVNGMYINYQSALRIKILDSSLTSASALQTYLSTNPLKVKYQLATPTYTEITDTDTLEGLYQIEHILMYKGYTHIECLDELKPDIYLDYLYNNDVNNTFGGIIAELNARIHALETASE